MHPTKESLKKGKEPAEPRFQPEIEAYPHLFFAQKRWSLRKIDTNTQVHPYMEGRPFSKHSGTRIEPMTKIATDNCSKAEVAVPPRRESATTQTARLAQLATQPRSFYAKQTQSNRISAPLLFADNRSSFFAWEQLWKNKPLAEKKICHTNTRCTQFAQDVQIGCKLQGCLGIIWDRQGQL